MPIIDQSQQFAPFKLLNRAQSATVALALFILVPFVFAQPAGAQQPAAQTLTVRPAVVDLVGEPGQTLTSQITLTNQGSDVQAIEFVPQSLLQIETELDASRRQEFDASQWLSSSNGDVLLAPGESRVVDLSIQIPSAAVNPGGHYANAVFRLLSSQESSSGVASVVPEVSVAVLVTVVGDIVESAILPQDSFAVDANSGGVDISYTLENTGNVHILPRATVYISDGQVDVAELPVRPQLVLPNSAKPFQVSWQPAANFKSYQARVEVSYGTPLKGLVAGPSKFRSRLSRVQVGAAVTLLGIGSVFAYQKRLAVRPWLASRATWLLQVAKRFRAASKT